MLAFLTDEDVHGPIVDGLRLHHPEIDFVRAIDVGLAGMDDAAVLDWAADHGRVTISHDVNTMTDAANIRITAGLESTGLIVIPQSVSIAKAIADIRFVADVCAHHEMRNVTLWLPL